MARRQTLFLEKGADRARCAAKWLLGVAVCLLLVQGGRTQSKFTLICFVNIFVHFKLQLAALALYKLIVCMCMHVADSMLHAVYMYCKLRAQSVNSCVIKNTMLFSQCEWKLLTEYFCSKFCM